MNSTKKPVRVAVAMSGGLDSSVAAAILRQQGYEVIGLTMKVYTDESRCCGLEHVLQAKRVADFLRIRHYSINLTVPFRETVIERFISEYLSGRTPNPCAICNQKIKFGALLRRAKELDCSALATGHYARAEPRGERHLLKRARDKAKSQAYFLALLTQDSLRSAMFPLGELTYDEVLRLAREFRLPLRERRSSQEVCFVPKEGHASFIVRETGRDPGPGPLLDLNGNVVGEHMGYIRYTIGQRKGLGAAFGSPRYVLRIIPDKNAVVIGEEENLYSPGLIARDVNWIPFDTLKASREVDVKIRYGSSPVPATIAPLAENRVKVTFRKPQKSVTPGQLAVFYDGDVVLGGGWIEEEIKP